MAMKEMTLEQFRKWCAENDHNIVHEYDFKRFPITCGKCGSNNIQLSIIPEHGKQGSEFTGYMRGFYNDTCVLLKCIDCGSAMIYEKE
jgi:hypothetical protein